MPSTTVYSFGDIVLVRFPFTDQQGSKQRPAAVVSNAAYNRARPDLILMAVTSQVKPKPSFGEVCIEDWKAAGLLKPSALKPILFTAEKTIIARTLGRLNAGDLEALTKALGAVLG